ncbi:MAG: hypothetical protein BBJ57_07435 [Desulfobacterales bacterium PC51MH44]|nr:MAG: hypothetical protein BBJ57_07435 [Desulfobacterales bacterium PC51MH44]
MAYKKTEIDKLEDDYVIKTVDEFFNIDQDLSMQMLQRITFRNILYYMGEQWMNWAKQEQIFRRIIKKNSPPTPVSNIIRDYVRSMKALILNKDFSVTIWPNSPDTEDAEAAKLGELVLKDMEAANDEEFLDEKEKIAMWTVLAGTTFGRTFPELDRGQWYLDDKGDMLKTGEVVTESVSLFNVRVDLLGDSLNRKRAVGVQSVKPREWVEDTFHVGLSTDEAEQATNYQKKLMKMVASVSPWKGAGLESLSDVEDDDMVIFKEIEYKPDLRYPNGRYVGTCCGQALFAHDKMPIPISEEGKWEYTLTDFHYYYVPGRFWSDAGVNDLISPQNTINQIDQALEVNRKSLGRSMVAISSKVEIQKKTDYGEHLLILKYDALKSGGQKPEFRQGIPLPAQVLDERQIHRQVAQEAAGDPKNVMRGQAPSAQASGVMVDTLREAAEQGHTPDVMRFYRGIKRTKRKSLILAKQLYTEERTIKIAGKGNEVEVRTFKGSELRDNTDVRMELASGLSSTKTGQVQMFLKLIEAGFFGPESQIDPEFREELMRKMGLSGFADKDNADVQRAQGENSLISHASEDETYQETKIKVKGGVKTMKVIPSIAFTMNDPEAENPDDPQAAIEVVSDPKFKYDNHAIHFAIHRDFIISQQFKSLLPDSKALIIMHTDYHKFVMKIQMEEAMAQQLALQEQAQGGQKPGGPPKR